MKKVCALALVMAALSAVVLPGCGRAKKETYALKARGILKDANSRMREVKTLKASGSYDLKTKAAGAGAMSFTFNMEMDVAEPEDPLKRISIESQGKKGDVYITGGYAYSQTDEGEWVKVRAEESESLAQSTPQGMTELAENAVNLRMVSEDGASYTIAFNVSGAYLEEQIMNALGSGSAGVAAGGQLEGIVKNTSMSAELKVSKETGYITQSTIKMNIKAVPAVGDLRLGMQMSFSGFNEPVEIALPAEARSARLVEVTPRAPATSSPVLPGL